MSREPKTPQYQVGQTIGTSLESATRADGKVRLWRPGTQVFVEEVLPSREWGDPLWPRYRLRYPDNSIGSLDESHLSPDLINPPKAKKASNKPFQTPSLF